MEGSGFVLLVCGEVKKATRFIREFDLKSVFEIGLLPT